jgi:hypothetical protein
MASVTSTRWKLKDSDADATRSAYGAPHQKPMWTFSGGGIAISAPDLGDAHRGSWRHISTLQRRPHLWSVLPELR